MDIYRRLRVAKRVNGAGLLTRLGGSLMDGEVLDAMREAASAFVDMAELQTRAGSVIATHTGAEAGIVTSGAAAALTLATCACLTGTDVALMERLPDASTMRNEVIIHRAHRTGYDHAIRAAGAKLIEIGFNDRGAGAGVRSLEGWEIEAAISEKTAAIAYTATPELMPKLASVVAVAERYALPIIVDAAAQLPPKDNLKRFIGEGAALVAFSGGKAIRGPQGTGILCGREKLVAAALMQMLDMDVLPETWTPPEGLLARHFGERFPHHGLGRGFKVDKESIIGLLVALERFVAADIEADIAARHAMLRCIARSIADLPGCTPRALQEVAGTYPSLDIEIDTTRLGDAYAVSLALQRHDPPVHLSERLAAQGLLSVASAGLGPGDAEIVAQALRQVIGARGEAG
ncbi:L-seryl-tRNA(Ser) seleniumtransferase [Rhizobiales bacterium GAS191]|nr:L-seryl-tRNA(Ser) seleniumtransferase [Rhizobiales bacterium GAS191]